MSRRPQVRSTLFLLALACVAARKPPEPPPPALPVACAIDAADAALQRALATDDASVRVHGLVEASCRYACFLQLSDDADLKERARLSAGIAESRLVHALAATPVTSGDVPTRDRCAGITGWGAAQLEAAERRRIEAIERLRALASGSG